MSILFLSEAATRVDLQILQFIGLHCIVTDSYYNNLEHSEGTKSVTFQ